MVQVIRMLQKGVEKEPLPLPELEESGLKKGEQGGNWAIRSVQLLLKKNFHRYRAAKKKGSSERRRRKKKKMRDTFEYVIGSHHGKG